jgi:hypothetical protein
METHLFRVGQMVTITRSPHGNKRQAYPHYKVLSVIPRVNGSNAYCVKTIMESEPRMVLETECRAARGVPPVLCLNEIEPQGPAKDAAMSARRAPRTAKEALVNAGFIRIMQQHEPVWTVVRGPNGTNLLTFRFKAHAVAYGRALAHAQKLTLFVDDRNGFTVRQEPETLTYPSRLH